jgi:hypothetical protein
MPTGGGALRHRGGPDERDAKIIQVKGFAERGTEHCAINEAVSVLQKMIHK